MLAYQRNFNNAYTDFAIANGLDSGRFGINRDLWQAHFGAIWNPVKNVDIGAEYIFGRRKTLAGEAGDMSRIDLSAKYNFN
ncbi:DcaP family trimeric outer membrane transporter [Undibacterium arcticum]